MWRYLKAAFWAKPEIPGLRRLPINALAVLLVGAVGFVQPWVWIAGGFVELSYLGLLVGSSRFRRIVDVIDRRRPEAQEARRKHWVESLSVSDRHRLAELMEKGERVMDLLAVSSSPELLEHQRLALDRLEDAYLRLLVARRGVEREDPNKEIREARRKLDRLGRELELLGLSEEKRRAKEQQRVALAESLSAAEQRQGQGLSMRADLEKIETEVALAVDRAARQEPSPLAESLDFESPIFDASRRGATEDQGMDFSLSPKEAESLSNPPPISETEEPR